MKVDLSLEKNITNTDACYIVINNVFYIKVKKDLWHQLASYLKIDVEADSEKN